LRKANGVFFYLCHTFVVCLSGAVSTQSVYS
jgi:hypothetical protein